MDNIGGVMREGQQKALKSLAILAGMLVYLGMIGYSAVHNWSLLSAGVAPEMLIWAAVGVLALEVSALALPLALHYWTFSPIQRYAAFAFYFLDLALIFGNVILDYAIVARTATLPTWLTTYLFYGVPATPIIAGLGWSILWLLDPSMRARGMVETLRASTREVLSIRIAEQAKAADVSDLVDAAAGELARSIVAETLAGAPRPAPLPFRRVEPSRRTAFVNHNTEADQPQELIEAAHPNGSKPGAQNGQESRG